MSERRSVIGKTVRFFNNPVFVMELRKQMRGRRPMLSVGAYLFFIISAVVTALTAGLAGVTGTDYAKAGQAVFWTIFSFQLIAILLVAPALGAAALPKERENKTLPFLMATPLTPEDILWGKWLVAVSFCAVLLVLAFPMYAIVFMLGGVSFSEMFFVNYLQLLVAGLVASLGLTLGVNAKKTLVAAIGAYFITYVVMSPLIGGLGIGMLMGSSGRGVFADLLAQGARFKIAAITTLPIVCAILTMVYFARERLVGWRDRGRGFRIFYFLLPISLPWYVAMVDQARSGASSVEVMAAMLLSLGAYYGLLILLAGVRTPDKRQLKLSFGTALLRGLRPKEFFRDDPLTQPLFLPAVAVGHFVVLILSWLVISSIYGGVSFPGRFEITRISGLFLLLLYILAQTYFWSFYALALGLWFQPRRAVNAGVAVLFGTFLIFTWSAVDSSPYIFKLLSPFSFMDENFRAFGSNMAGYHSYNDPFTATVTAVSLLVAMGTVSLVFAFLGWRRLQKRGLKPRSAEEYDGE